MLLCSVKAVSSYREHVDFAFTFYFNRFCATTRSADRKTINWVSLFSLGNEEWDVVLSLLHCVAELLGNLNSSFNNCILDTVGINGGWSLTSDLRMITILQTSNTFHCSLNLYNLFSGEK